MLLRLGQLEPYNIGTHGGDVISRNSANTDLLQDQSAHAEEEECTEDVW